MSKRWLSVLILLLCSGVGLFAQGDKKEEDAAKEKLRRQTVLVESLIADARELRLPENRAILLAKVGSRLWDIDQKRAGDFFRDAVNELLGAQAAAEANRKSGQQQSELLTGQSTRPQILQAIAAHDAEFALQSLYKTRPAAIERALANKSSKDSKVRNNPGSDQYLAQNELNMEHAFMRQAADQNPARAIELLKAALKNGVSNETLPLLKKLFEKDPNAANELAADVVSQISRKTFMIANQPDYQSIQLAMSLLAEFIRERPATEKTLRFDDSQMKGLAEKIITFYLDRGSQYGYVYGPSLVQIAEKLSPGTVERIKQAYKTTARNGFGRGYQDENVTKLLNGDTPVEQMLAEAAKLPIESRGQVYQSAANKLIAAGNITGARAVLNDNFSDEALENAVNNLNNAYAYQLMNAGRFTEAEALIDEFPDTTRNGALINLANSVYNKDAVKNKSYASALLEKARTQLPARPETNNDMSQTMQIIAAYSTIEPAEGFRMFDALVPQINDVMEASLVVSAFQGGYNIRQGEMVISQGNSMGIYLDYSIFRTFAQNDFDRTLSMINAFSRREMRVTMKEQLLAGL